MARNKLGHKSHKPLDALTHTRQNQHKAREPTLEKHQKHAILDTIHLVENHHLDFIHNADLLEHRAHGLDLHERLGERGVHNVKKKIRGEHLLEGRVKALDEAVREVADEADGVREEHHAAQSDLPRTHTRVERREEL